LFDSAGSAGNLIPHTLSHGTYKRLKKKPYDLSQGGKIWDIFNWAGWPQLSSTV